MRDRLFRCGRMLATALCLLSVGGLMYSCSDDYDLPDKTPEWLGSSIYNYLVEKGNYTNTVKLIDDLDYAEVLAKTGSKTLFVANDEAYEKFYQNNSWGVRSYKDLTRSQKKLLLNNAMLDNAYLLEMLPNSTSNSYVDGSYVTKNVCLKSPTSAAATDSIPFYWYWDEAIPHSTNPDDVDYWARFRTQAKGGIRLASDGSVPMLAHWVNGQMQQNSITDGDFSVIMGKEREANDVYINSSKVVEQDITCQNGYINVVENVMMPPASMAEMIRTNGLTDLYSHLLDRFSAPYYSSFLTSAYHELDPTVDSVFEKRYFSAWSHGSSSPSASGASNYYAPDDVNQTKAVTYYLDFDPGWNLYYPREYSQSEGQARDFGCMFVPTDDALLKYFQSGGGKFLSERYFTVPVQNLTKENLKENLDLIPQEVIVKMVNNLMKSSFLNSVPSKYLSIQNDAKDVMFANYETEDEYKSLIDTAYVASNGVIYVMNTIISPADYACVAAPTLVNEDLKIFKWGIYADDKYFYSPENALMGTFMSVYLKAMNSTFSLFCPSDEAFHKYYDPVSLVYTQPYLLDLSYDANSDNIIAKAYRYDNDTYEPTDAMSKAITNTIIYDRMTYIMNTHTVVHDNDVEPEGITPGKEWFVTREGAPIKVTGCTDNTQTFQIQGGLQIDRNQFINVTKVYNQSRELNGYGNGKTYVVDGVAQSTQNSVYKILYGDGAEDSPYRKFFELCEVDDDVLEEAGYCDDQTTRTDKDRVLSRYAVFTSEYPSIDYTVRFFNNYNYTIFVPTNDAVKEAIEQKGLPTWESIAQYIQSQKDIITAHEGDESFDVDAFTTAYKTKAKAMCSMLLNFVKYHFMDNSVFADVVAQAEALHETASINYATNRYNQITVSSTGNHTLTVTDNDGHTREVITGTYSEDGSEKEGKYNVLACDARLTNTRNSQASSGVRPSNLNFINVCSYAVIHQIDGVLNYEAMPNGRYDSSWTTVTAAQRYLEKYGIR